MFLYQLMTALRHEQKERFLLPTRPIWRDFRSHSCKNIPFLYNSEHNILKFKTMRLFYLANELSPHFLNCTKIFRQTTTRPRRFSSRWHFLTLQPDKEERQESPQEHSLNVEAGWSSAGCRDLGAFVFSLRNLLLIVGSKKPNETQTPHWCTTTKYLPQKLRSRSSA